MLHSIVVAKEQREQGQGSRMLAALEEAATAQGYRWAMLQVLASNKAAHRLYQ